MFLLDDMLLICEIKNQVNDNLQVSEKVYRQNGYQKNVGSNGVRV